MLATDMVICMVNMYILIMTLLSVSNNSLCRNEPIMMNDAKLRLNLPNYFRFVYDVLS